jgi:hypothetical protein
MSTESSSQVVEPKASFAPSSKDFLITEENIPYFENCLLAEDKKVQNANKGWHADWYLKTEKEGDKNKKIEFFLEKVQSDFGIGYSGEADDKKYGGVLIPAPVKKEGAEAKDEKKEDNKDPGFQMSCSEKKNAGVKNWIEVWNRVCPHQFSLHSKNYKGKEIPLEKVIAGDMCVKVSKPSENPANAERYGGSFKFKVQRSTKFLKKSLCGKYDIPTTMQALWKQKGCTYDIYGQVYKLNFDVRGGHAMSFLATTIIMYPKVEGYGAAESRLNLPPPGFVDGVTNAPQVPATILPPTVVTESTNTVAPVVVNNPPSPSSNEEILGSAGIHGRRVFED